MQPLIDQITRLFHEDIAKNLKAVHRDDIPLTYESITNSWLTDVLCRDVTGAQVDGFQLGEKDDGTSNRRRIFISYNSAGERAGLPASVFCKAAQTLRSRLTLGTIGCTHAEYTFYRCVRGELDIVAPIPLWVNYDPQSFASILVLDDLGPDFQFCDQRTEITRDHAVSLVSLLAQVHGRFYQSAKLGVAPLTFTTWTDWFARLEAIGMEEYTTKGFRAAEDVVPAGLFRRQDEIWGATLRSVALHRNLPHTLIHSDVHLKNWYVATDGSMGLGDWQSVCIGNWSRDFAYAIGTALSVANRRAWERDLLGIYIDRMRAQGAPPISFDDAFQLYRQQLFAALAFWTVTLTPPPVMPDMQPVATTLAFIERLAHAIDDLNALDSF